MTFHVPRAWFYLLFTLSGFAGLIYESIWSHYLKLFLGHAAYAQTLVLAIFMGGMALGSWVCSRYSHGWRNLLLGYAVAEALIGLAALLFHRIFVSATDFAFDSVIPALGSPLAVNAFKWTLSALLILPQSILLGMTFPLMTAGLIRAFPGGSGGAIAMLYFTNSLGAAVGVLASGFVLIALVGLPGTMLTAGLINVVLAAVVWLLAKAMPAPAGAAVVRESAGAVPVRGYRALLAVSLLTGAASFIYEIGWIRMLSLVLGSSTHAFELMLSAFILGLACGGLWIKRRIDGIAVPEVVLGVVQVAMGMLALSTLLVYGQTFEIMRWLLAAVARNDNGYGIFNMGSHLIALLVMFPAAFCAGMTLPLITHALLRRGAGEGAIGAVYAANTIGAILGVFFAVHVGMPTLGLKGLIIAGAAIDIGLGVYLLLMLVKVQPLAAYATTAGLAAIAASAALVEIDPYKMASGVYRHGSLLTEKQADILFHRDGKVATVNLLKFPTGIVSILTNGKSDAALNLEPAGTPTRDETTMIMTGALPLALMPDAKTAANIGFGSGLTTHVLLASDGIREVDTIEIEKEMVEAARGFRPRNENVFGDSRSHIYIEDAKTFFSTHRKRYDIITSEPSNPWVSGVASLFTDEFYSRVKRYLTEQGIFVQWIQLYENNPALIASIFKALAPHFSDYVVYSSYEYDIIIVARNGARLAPLSEAIFGQPRLVRELERINIRTVGDMELHRIGNKKAMQPFFESIGIPANSDFFPVLDLNAAKARFLGADAHDIVKLAMAPIPALEMLGGVGKRRGITVAPRPWLVRAEHARQALAGSRYLVSGNADAFEQVPAALRSDFELVRLLMTDCARNEQMVSVDTLYSVAGALVRYLTGDELRPVWNRLSSASCADRLGEPRRSWIALFEAISDRDAERMAARAERMLARGGERSGLRLGYLLGTAITGRLAQNERDRAVALWRAYSGKVVASGNDMLPELLRAHLFGNTNLQLANRHRAIRK